MSILINGLYTTSCVQSAGVAYTPLSCIDLLGQAVRQRGCSGVLYTLKTLPGRKSPVRTPARVLPYHSIISALQKLLLRPGFYQQLQHWRGPNDHEVTEPMSREEWLQQTAFDEPLSDISQGWLWRSLTAGTVRTWNSVNSQWSDTPCTPDGNVIRFVSLPCGIVLQMNVDWYVHCLRLQYPF